MLDLAAAKEAYVRFKIDEIGWFAIKANIVDGFTKKGRNFEMEKLLKTSRLEYNILQWAT